MSGRIAINLSERQVHALDLLSQGLSLVEIGKKFGCTANAVGSSLHHAYRKLGATSAAHAVRIGMETGLLTGTDVELGRAYKALAVANAELASRQVGRRVSAHPFGEYLLSLREVA